MFGQFLARLRTGRVRRSRTGRESRRSGRREPRFELLEPRQLLSTTVATPPATAALAAAAAQTAPPVAQFTRFTSAQDLEQYLIQDALTRYQGLFGQTYWDWRYWPDYANITTVGGATTSSGTTGSTPLDYAGTNTQIAGVDEGDLVKTDGHWLYMLTNQELVIVDDWPADQMHVESHTKLLGQPVAEYLNGNRLTILSNGGGGIMPLLSTAAPATIVASTWWNPTWWNPKLTVTVLDVTDRTAPTVVQSTDLDGMLIDSRAVGNHVYLVMRDNFFLPQPNVIPPSDSGNSGGDSGSSVTTDPFVFIGTICGQGGTYETQDQYLARVTGHALELTLPTYTAHAADGSVLKTGLVNEATDIYQPGSSNETYLASVVTFDMASDLPGPASSVSVPAQDASHLFASQQNLYLFGNVWSNNTATTSILKFSRDDTVGRVDFVAAGSVPGNLLNQFSADEYQGDLRVATSIGWGSGASSGIYVLRQADQDLSIVGQLDGLAPGESIYSARFLGNLAFLCTFLGRDPLWVVDLSTPEQPKVSGQLDIPGFSNYLQAIGDGYVIGIGRDADPTTGAWRSPQVSLFDVSDPAHPQLVDRYSIDVGPWAWSDAFSDHHAVGYYPEYGVLTLSMRSSGQWLAANGVPYSCYLAPQTHLYVFKIDTSADPRSAKLELLGTVQHDTPIDRTVRVEDVLYSISSDTVSAHPILSPGDELARIYFGDNMTQLGPVDTVKFDASNGTNNVPWYEFTAIRDGVLAVSASSAGQGNGVGLTLYDDNFKPLGNSDANDGQQKIDLATRAGAKYYLRVSPFNSAVSAMSFSLQMADLTAISIAGRRDTAAPSGPKNFPFSVSLSSAVATPITVAYSVVGDTATPGRDFLPVHGTLTFQPGQSLTQTINVPVFGLPIYRADKTFHVVLSSPGGNAAFAQDTAQGTIRSSIAPPKVRIADISAREGNSGTSPATFMVILSAPSASATVVRYSTQDGTATAGPPGTGDYQAVTDGSVTIPAGATCATFKILVNGDTRFENTETFSVKLTGATGATIPGGTASAVCKIPNDDLPPTVSIRGTPPVTEPTGPTPAGTTPAAATFTVKLSAASDVPVSVTYSTADLTAKAGTNYVPVHAQTLVFAPGTTSQTFNVSVLATAVPHGNLTFRVVLTAGYACSIDAAASSATETIWANTANTVALAAGAVHAAGGSPSDGVQSPVRRSLAPAVDAAIGLLV